MGDEPVALRVITVESQSLCPPCRVKFVEDECRFERICLFVKGLRKVGQHCLDRCLRIFNRNRQAMDRAIADRDRVPESCCRSIAQFPSPMKELHERKR